MTSEGLGEMFEGNSADSCAGKFPLMLMGGRAEGLACADLGATTIHRREWIFLCLQIQAYSIQNNWLLIDFSITGVHK